MKSLFVSTKVESRIAALEKAGKTEKNLAQKATGIIDSLAKPNRDPRDELPKPIFRRDVLKIEDLREGMILEGTVRNVVDFGAFVDIGVKNDGLVHKSQLSKGYVKHPTDVLNVGKNVRVKVISTNPEAGKISLSMILD